MALVINPQGTYSREDSRLTLSIWNYHYSDQSTVAMECSGVEVVLSLLKTRSDVTVVWRDNTSNSYNRSQVLLRSASRVDVVGRPTFSDPNKEGASVRFWAFRWRSSFSEFSTRVCTFCGIKEFATARVENGSSYHWKTDVLIKISKIFGAFWPLSRMFAIVSVALVLTS